jgi:hypothetical protein
MFTSFSIGKQVYSDENYCILVTSKKFRKLSTNIIIGRSAERGYMFLTLYLRTSFNNHSGAMCFFLFLLYIDTTSFLFVDTIKNLIRPID